MHYPESTATVAPHQDHGILSLRNAGQGALYVRGTGGFLTVHAYYDVPGLQAGFFGRTTGLDPLNYSSLEARGRPQLLAHIRG